MKNKPIEIRNLKHPDLTQSQGSAYLWVEIFEKNGVIISNSTLSPLEIEKSKVNLFIINIWHA